jgi:hypothetical protein
MKYIAYALLAAVAAFGVGGCASIFPGSSALISQYPQRSPDGHPWVPQYQGASAAAAPSGAAGPTYSGPAGPIYQTNRDGNPWLPQYQGASAAAGTSAPAVSAPPASASGVPAPPIPPVAATQ